MQVCNLAYFVVVPSVLGSDFTNGLREMEIKVPFSSLPAKLTGVVEGECTKNREICKPGDKACEVRNKATCLQIPWIAMYMGAAYKYAVALGSVIAVLMIMIGGIMYMVSGFNVGLVDKAKSMMVGSVTGLVLLIGSYLVMYFVNPALLNLEILEVEIIKEQLVIDVAFCHELAALDPKKGLSAYNIYEANGKTIAKEFICGKEYIYESNVKETVHKGKCFGQKCTGFAQICLPCKDLDKKGYCQGEINEKTMGCGEAKAWGMIKNHGDGRNIDYMKIWGIDPLSVTTSTFADGSIDLPDENDNPATAYIFWTSKTPNWPGPNKTKSFLMQVEINDTNVVNMDKAYRPTGLGGTFLKAIGKSTLPQLTPSSDDTFYVMPVDTGKNLSEYEAVNASGTKQMIKYASYTDTMWFLPCKGGNCVVGDFKGPESWNFAFGAYEDPPFKGKCTFIDPFYTAAGQGGVRMDIDTQDFLEDGDLDCSGVEKTNNEKNKGKMKVGESCTRKEDCISGDCETERGIQKCECNEDSHCPAGSYCNSSWAHENQCAQEFPLGHACTDDQECHSKACKNSICVCDDDSDCKMMAPTVVFPSHLNIAYKDKFQAKCTEENSTSCTVCVPADPVDWADHGAGENATKPASYNVCINDADCCGGTTCNTSQGYCICNSNTPKAYGDGFCNDSGFWEKSRDIGDFCTKKEECYYSQNGSDCVLSNWYKSSGSNPSYRCECKQSNFNVQSETCPKDHYCVDVEDDCGWNYCMPFNLFVAQVDAEYNSSSEFTITDLLYRQGWGLCGKDTDCTGTESGASASCQANWGANDCRACGPYVESGGQ